MASIRKRRSVKEIIGNIALVPVKLWQALTITTTVDETVPNYSWWDRFRRGKIEGFKLSSLLAKPAAEVTAAWVLGEGVTAELEEADEYTNDLLRRFMNRIKGLLHDFLVDLYSLGDQYIIVNADTSLSIPSPDTVEVKRDRLDYRKVQSVTITNRLPEATVTDEYYPDRRVIRVKNTGKDVVFLNDGTAVPAGREATMEFDNLIGRIPVVHFANERSANETNGRPIYASMVEWFSWYEDILIKALMGVNRLSNPILAFVGLDDPDETEDANSSPIGEEYLDDDGVIRQRNQVDIDADTPAVFVGKGGDVKFVGPGTGITDDIRNMLKVLYLLWSEHLGLPDVVMGFELSAGRSSAVEQIKTFFARITARRTSLEGAGSDPVLGLDARDGLKSLIEIWLEMRSLTDTQVQVGPVVVMWPELGSQDEQLTKAWADGAHDRGLIRDETYVELSGRVENAAEEVEMAREEVLQRREEEQTRLDREDEDGVNDDSDFLNDDEVEDEAA